MLQKDIVTAFAFPVKESLQWIYRFIWHTFSPFLTQPYQLIQAKTIHTHTYGKFRDERSAYPWTVRGNQQW